MTPVKFTLYLSLICGLFIASCKDRDPTIAEITIVDAAGNPISGATVKLYCSTGTGKKCDNAGGIGTGESVQTSDGSGKTSHEFKLAAVLKILATKGNLVGEDFVKLEEHTTVQKTVTVK